MWRVAIRVAGWLAPPARRAEWRRLWRENLRHWRVLQSRGELPPRSGVAFLRRAFADAARERFGPLHLNRILRGPVFLVVALSAALILMAVSTHGFQVTRQIVALAGDIRSHPHPGLRYDLRGDRVFVYCAPIVVAASVGLALIFLKRRSLRALGWRSWSLLAFETLSLFCIASLFWVEGGHALRSHLARPALRFGLAGFSLAWAYILALGFAVLWSIADQRRRCPVCLHRLMLPVAIGSWASIFDPAATEMVCDEGHGSLALIEADTEATAPDRWTEMDSSWQYLFHDDSR